MFRHEGAALWARTVALLWVAVVDMITVGFCHQKNVNTTKTHVDSSYFIAWISELFQHISSQNNNDIIIIAIIIKIKA